MSAEKTNKNSNKILQVVIVAVIFIAVFIVAYIYINARNIRRIDYNILSGVFFVLLFGLYFSFRNQRKKLEKAYAELKRSKDEQEEQLHILRSMADIYYSMHLINLNDNSAIVYEAKNQVSAILAESEETSDADLIMRKVMRATMDDSYYEAGLEFSDVNTLKSRMKNKKIISKDLLGKNVGWIRMSFITIESDDNNVPKKVICTTQIIDEEKKKEEKLIRDSNTDELTQCFNRRAYEDDIMIYPDIPTEENFVYVAMDINGLKVTNDTLGHEAGDELIIGAVSCMKRCIGNYGKIYRVGGDEFVAMIFADEDKLEFIKKDFEETQSRWTGKLVKQLSVSAGYVTKREFPDMTVVEMAKIADERMYQEKTRFYNTKGIDRRGQAAAHTALLGLYTKILKVNLTDDSYSIVNMNMDEQSEAKGFSDSISKWLEGFGKSGQVHVDDLEGYLKQTDIDYLRKYFASNKASISIYYRRKYGDIFKQVVMEMITADDYSNDNQSLFLYVRSIDK